ncbi:hypothetical protein FGW37_01470 [Streptomyces rectiverticillatus]|uniref:DUF7224 domain-containing protein n=1 Tax=Streptomyces rectiverticillatus TaxID=173860 RepID=UPI0015C3575A|nr:hypothetical protein [Streptomyces rectiverticillatus]QLE70452.1 hypothetical protein FGW37_01470 [Streptomyces rectiverticillatus]
MRRFARWRTSSALWLAPVCLAVVLLYFKSMHQDPGYTDLLDGPSWAPSLVARALDTCYWLAYAVAVALGAWEAGRLKKDRIWLLAPARSRHRIAAETLLPGVMVGWGMLLLPVVMALAEAGTWPTVDALPLLIMGMLLVCAYATIGFTIGLRVHRAVSAPLLGAAVLYLVGWSASDSERLWPRHISGQYTEGLLFGELVPFSGLWPHLLFAGSLAAFCALAWIAPAAKRARIALRSTACAAALAVMAACVAHVHSWGAVGPLSVNNAPLDCAGDHPRVCVPQAVQADVGGLRQEITRAVAALRDAGVAAPVPEAVNDTLAAGRSSTRSTGEQWWLPLSKSVHPETVRLNAVLKSVRFPCSRTDQVNSRSATLWAATVAGADERYLAWQKQQLQQFQNHDEVMDVMKRRVAKARALPKEQQSAWYEHELMKACANAGKDTAS